MKTAYLDRINGHWKAFVYVLSQKRSIGESQDKETLTYWLRRRGYHVIASKVGGTQ